MTIYSRIFPSGSCPPESVPLRFLELTPPLKPVLVTATDIDVTLASAAGDLDGDGRDESVWAMPLVDDTGASRCGINILSVPGDDISRAALEPTSTLALVLDEPCTGAQLDILDADGDGQRDIVFLSGTPGAPGRKLLVFWNDVEAGFSAERLTDVARPGDVPEAFTSLPATLGRPFSFAYVTSSNVVLVSSGSAARSFDAYASVADVARGTGIVTGDFNGDGVTDLAVAAAGDVQLFSGGLVVP